MKDSPLSRDPGRWRENEPAAEGPSAAAGRRVQDIGRHAVLRGAQGRRRRRRGNHAKHAEQGRACRWEMILTHAENWRGILSP